MPGSPSPTTGRGCGSQLRFRRPAALDRPLRGSQDCRKHPRGENRHMTVLARLLAGGLAACMLVFVAFGPGPATAQTWPTRTVRFVVPFPAGGSADTLARLLGQKITEPLGQPVVVENKPGAGGERHPQTGRPHPEST